MPLISHNEIIDKDTGVIISENSRSLKIPGKIFINGSFTKIFDNTRFDLTPNELGYFMMLTPYMEYQTNRLTISSQGVNSKKLLHKEMAKILYLSVRRVISLWHRYKDKKIMFKIDGWYYISPKYALRGRGVFIDIFQKMMDYDDLTGLCTKKDLFLIKKYKEINNIH